MATQTVVVVDDDVDFRRSMAAMLQQAGYAARSYESAAQFFADCDQLSGVGCVLLDERIRGESGLEAYRQLRGRGVQWPVILITGHATVSLAVDALDSGVSYLMEKPVDGPMLLSRLEQCLEESQDQQRRQARQCEQQRRLETLSQRELQVVEMLADGLLNKQIAKRLDVSLRTVETYRKRVMEKTGAESLADLVVFAVSVGIRDASSPGPAPPPNSRSAQR